MKHGFEGIFNAIVSAFQRRDKAAATTQREEAYEAFLESETEEDAETQGKRESAAPLRAAVVVIKRGDGKSRELRATLESINAQTYANFTLTEDIAGAECEFVVRAEEGAVLTRDALMHYAREFSSEEKPRLVYSDSDMQTSDGVRTRPRFLGEFSEADALTHDIFGGCFAIERKLYLACVAPRGGSGYERGEASEGYSLALRCLARAGMGGAKHIPRVLYSRMGKEEALPYTEGAEAIEQYAKATGQKLKVGAGLYQGSFRTGARAWPMKTGVILPFLDDVDSLRASLESIEEHAKFFEPVLVIADAGSKSKRARDYLEILEKNRAATVVRRENAGFSALMNAGARAAMTEGLLFFSPYARAKSVELILALAEQAARRKAGAVGCMLTDEAGYIRHAGYVVGLAGALGTPFAGTLADGGGTDDFDEYVRGVRAVSAVSGMCMYVSGEAFFSAGMFDESFDVPSSPLFPVGQDAELSLRLMRRGLTNIYTPYARAELVKTPPDISGAPERVRMRAYDAMRSELSALDRFYSPNLSRETVVPTPSRSHKPPKPF